jgi:hypothetical protein
MKELQKKEFKLVALWLNYYNHLKQDIENFDLTDCLEWIIEKDNLKFKLDLYIKENNELINHLITEKK